MKKTMLADVLRSFSKEEMKRFVQFADSPYFNTSNATAKLLKEIGRFHPVFDGKGVSKEILFEKVYGAKKYSDALMRKLISNLLQLSEKFLTVENQQFKEYSCLKGLRVKKLSKSFSNRIDHSELKPDDFLIDEDVFLLHSLIQAEKTFFYYETDRYQDYEKSKSISFSYNSLYYFYVLAQNTIKAKNKMANDQRPKETLAEIIISTIDLRQLKKRTENLNIKHKETLLHLYDLMLLYMTKDEALYRKIKTFTFAYSAKHPEKILYLGYIYLINFAYENIRQGKSNYLYELHEINKKIETDYFSSNAAKITLLQFNSLFFTGIQTKDLAFSEYLLDKYISGIESRGNPGLNKLYRAWIFFHKGNFRESLANISTFNTSGYALDNFVLIQHTKQLFLQSYYELGYYEEAMNYLDAFLHFLKSNKKINKKFTENYTKYIRVYRMLLMYKIKDKLFNKNSIMESIKNETFAGKNWLIRKLEELVM